LLEYLYTPKEVAEILKCSLTFVYEHQDELGVIRIGKLMRFPESKLKKILNINLETQEAAEIQIPMEGTDDSVSEGVRNTARGKTRSSRKESQDLKDASDPYGIRQAVRESAERFGVEGHKEKILPRRQRSPYKSYKK